MVYLLGPGYQITIEVRTRTGSILCRFSCNDRTRSDRRALPSLLGVPIRQVSRFLPDGTEDSLGLFETRWIHPSTYDIRHLNFSPAGVGLLNCVSRKLPWPPLPYQAPSAPDGRRLNGTMQPIV